MKITIGIPTYNRKELLKIMAKSLFESDLSLSPNIRIYDDCSTEYNKDYLQNLFPTAVSIKINENNLRADRNTYQMYRDFINSEDDYFFNADSDIIFNLQWLNIALELVKQTDGILSLFNANSHEPYKIISNELCLKYTLGAAGVLFSRERLIELLDYFDSIEEVRNLDWQWSNYFAKKGVLMYCINNSMVQHIGYQGQNSKLYFDVGKNYKVESVEQGQIINDVLEKSISSIRLREKERTKELALANRKKTNDFSYHFKRCIILIVKKIFPEKIYKKLKNNCT